MILSIHFFYYIRADTVFVENKSLAQGPGISLSVQFLFPPGSEGFQKKVLRVREQGKRKSIFFCKLYMRGKRILAYPEYILSQGEESVVIVPQIAGFRSASGRAVLRVCVKHGLTTEQVFSLPQSAVLVLGIYCRHLISFLYHDFQNVYIVMQI